MKYLRGETCWGGGTSANPQVQFTEAMGKVSTRIRTANMFEEFSWLGLTKYSNTKSRVGCTLDNWTKLVNPSIEVAGVMFYYRICVMNSNSTVQIE